MEAVLANDPAKLKTLLATKKCSDLQPGSTAYKNCVALIAAAVLRCVLCVSLPQTA